MKKKTNSAKAVQEKGKHSFEKIVHLLFFGGGGNDQKWDNQNKIFTCGSIHVPLGKLYKFHSEDILRQLRKPLHVSLHVDVVPL